MKKISFFSRGVRCAAWHLPAATDGSDAGQERPCIVMAHGFSGTVDMGLMAFAEPLSKAGMDVLVFDYRGFGASDGEPRQDVSYLKQRQDYHAAIAAARHLPGVDPDRIILWGTSYSGGHSIAVAAQDRWIAAVIAMNPAVDGRAALLAFARHNGLGRLMRLASHGLLDEIRTGLGGRPHHLPAIGRPGSLAMMTTPGALEACVEIAGPSWRNEVRARAGLEAGLNRATIFAKHLNCPILFQIGSRDSVAPPGPTRKAARKTPGRATVREYLAEHFDFYGGTCQQQALADQINFLIACRLAPASDKLRHAA